MSDDNGGVFTLFSEYLFFSLILWVAYLMLPRGFRQYMCNSYPKRYARSSPNREIRILGSGAHIRRDGSPRRVMRERLLRGRRRGYRDDVSNASYSESSMSARSNRSRSSVGFGNNNGTRGEGRGGMLGLGFGLKKKVDSGITSARRNLNPAGSSSDHTDPWETPNFQNTSTNTKQNTVISPFQNNPQEEETVDFLTPEIQRNHTKISISPPPSLVELESLATFSNASPSPDHAHGLGPRDPSPVHPNVHTDHRVPSHMVLSSTLTSLREPGVRLSAHGTQCVPRRIWIQLEVYKEVLEWRTENQSVSDNPNDSMVLGPKHTIALRDILYVDVGKTTAALQMLSEEDIRSNMSFSILTKNGSLDLTAGNKLERDALISCMCLVLDTVNAGADDGGKSWRDLHISEGSVTSRSTNTGMTSHTGTGIYSRGTPSSAASGYFGGTSSAGFNDYSPSEIPTESDVYAGIETIDEIPSQFAEL